MPLTGELDIAAEVWNQEELKTPELCLAAVQNRYLAFEHVPEALKKSVSRQVRPGG